MNIYFKTKKTEKNFTEDAKMQKNWGIHITKKLKQRMMEIRASETLEVLCTIPGARCHKLTGKRDNQYAVDLKHPYRLIFEPYHSPMPLLSDGGFDKSKITSILIIEVVDYHGK